MLEMEQFCLSHIVEVDISSYPLWVKLHFSLLVTASIGLTGLGPQPAKETNQKKYS